MGKTNSSFGLNPSLVSISSKVNSYGQKISFIITGLLLINTLENFKPKLRSHLHLLVAGGLVEGTEVALVAAAALPVELLSVLEAEIVEYIYIHDILSDLFDMRILLG